MNKQDLIRAAKEWIDSPLNFGRLLSNRMYQFQRDLMDCPDDFGIIRIIDAGIKEIIFMPKKNHLEEVVQRFKLTDTEYNELKSLYWGVYLDYDPTSKKEAVSEFGFNANPADDFSYWDMFFNWVSRNRLFSILIIDCIGGFMIQASMDFLHRPYLHYSHWVIAAFFTIITLLIAASGNE